MVRYDDDLRFAHVLADAADDITTRRFRALDLRVETKPDLTPVSDADQAAEESLRNVLRRARPRDAVLGEEFGRSGFGPRCWVLGPIDGTGICCSVNPGPARVFRSARISSGIGAARVGRSLAVAVRRRADCFSPDGRDRRSTAEISSMHGL